LNIKIFIKDLNLPIELDNIKYVQRNKYRKNSIIVKLDLSDTLKNQEICFDEVENYEMV
jgi:hypothetical protein